MDDLELESMLNAALLDFETAAPAVAAATSPRGLHVTKPAVLSSSPWSTVHSTWPPAAQALVSTSGANTPSVVLPDHPPSEPSPGSATGSSPAQSQSLLPNPSTLSAPLAPAASPVAPRGGLLALDRRKAPASRSTGAVSASPAGSVPRVVPPILASTSAANRDAQLLMADLMRLVQEVNAGDGTSQIAWDAAYPAGGRAAAAFGSARAAGAGGDDEGADGDDEAEGEPFQHAGTASTSAAAGAAASGGSALPGRWGLPLHGAEASSPAGGLTTAAGSDAGHSAVSATGSAAQLGHAEEEEEDEGSSAAVRALMQRTRDTVAQQSKYARGEGGGPAAAVASDVPPAAPGGLAGLLGNLTAGLGGADGQEGGAGNMLIESIMRNLLGKDTLYKPLQEIRDHYPPWLTANANRFPAEEFARYVGQYEAVKRVCRQYEEGPGDFPAIVERIQEMQEFGDPPADIVDKIAGGLPPGLHSGPAGPGGGRDGHGSGSDEEDEAEASTNWDNLQMPALDTGVMKELEALMLGAASGGGPGGAAPQCPVQ